LIVFLPKDHRLPPNEYLEATGKTEALAKERDIQVDDRDAMAAFFDRYYGEGADLGQKMTEHRARGRFATLAAEFEMISARTQEVFVPFGNGKAFIDELASIGRMTRDLGRRLQRYRVGLRPEEFRAARNQLWEVRPESGLWVASDASYSEIKGLEFGVAAESPILASRGGQLLASAEDRAAATTSSTRRPSDSSAGWKRLK